MHITIKLWLSLLFFCTIRFFPGFATEENQSDTQTPQDYDYDEEDNSAENLFLTFPPQNNENKVNIYEKENSVDLFTTLTIIRKQIRISPEDSELYFQYGFALHMLISEYVSLGDWEQEVTVNLYGDKEDVTDDESIIVSILDAEKAYRKCLYMNPEHPDALTNLGKILADRVEYVVKNSMSIHIIDNNSGNNSSGGNNESDVKEDQKQKIENYIRELKDEIRYLFSEAVRTTIPKTIGDMPHLQSRINLGLHYYENSMFHESIRVYAEGISLMEQYLEYYYRQYQQQDKQEVEDLEEVSTDIQINLYYNYAIVLTKIGDINKAYHYFNYIVENVNAHHLQSWVNLSALHHQYGALKDAFKYYQKTFNVFMEILDSVSNKTNLMTGGREEQSQSSSSTSLSTFGRRFNDIFTHFRTHDDLLRCAILALDPVQVLFSSTSAQMTKEEVSNGGVPLLKTRTEFFLENSGITKKSTPENYMYLSQTFLSYIQDFHNINDMIVNDSERMNDLRGLFLMLLSNLGTGFKQKGEINDSFICYIFIAFFVREQIYRYEIMNYNLEIRLEETTTSYTTPQTRNNNGDHPSMMSKEEYDDFLIKIDRQKKKTEAAIQGEKQHLLEILILMFHNAKAGCYWDPLWDWLDPLLKYVIEFELSKGKVSSILPFDTLGLPIHPITLKRDIAYRYAFEYNDFNNKYLVNNQHQQETTKQNEKSQQFLFDNDESSYARTKLRLGFISHDFNEHPTAHLIEGLFYWYNISKHYQTIDSKIVGYSYGKDDGSSYRKNIVDLLGGERDIHINSDDKNHTSKNDNNFINLAATSLTDSIQIIRQDKPHIVFDLQGFTLGCRTEIVASRVAPIQVNYLVYPGTSGASFIDYIVADKIVIPPEHAHEHYTEKIAYLPRSYQANHYPALYDDNLSGEQRQTFTRRISRGSEEWRMLREENRLDPSPHSIVFCNFNKQDKIEPKVFSVWMKILSLVPNSVLWLLEPSSASSYCRNISNKNMPFDDNTCTTIKNLKNAAYNFGILPSRIIFASRTSKVLHMKRMKVADLFLDTLYYGAHSTATDALMAGLPILTLEGKEFPARVASSLLQNLISPVNHGHHDGRSEKAMLSLLITYSIQEYIDTATFLAKDMQLFYYNHLHKLEFHKMNRQFNKSLNILTKIRQTIEDNMPKSDIINMELYREDFEHLSKAMWEVYTFAESFSSENNDNVADKSDHSDKHYMHIVM